MARISTNIPHGDAILRYCVHKGANATTASPCGILDNKLIKVHSGNRVERSVPTICRTSMKYSPKKLTKKTVHFGMRQPPQAVDICKAACDERTGMNAEYADYDGKPHVDESNHWHFYSDAYRTAANIGLDAAWNGPQEVL